MNIAFSIRDYTYLLKEFLDLSSYEEGQLEHSLFSDGEVYHKIISDVFAKKVFLLGGTTNDTNTLELLDLSMGILQLGAKELNIIIPYYGYSTMERAVHVGEIVKAKTRANLFSSLATPHASVNIFLFDLHSEGIPYYFSKDIFTEHLYGKKIILGACHNLSDNFVLAATDAGRAKWVESLAQDMKVKSAFVYKQRLSGTETEITGVNADIKQQDVIIYDDMIRTGSSLMKAAEIYKKQGALRVYAICTHGLFTDNALQKIEAQGIIEKVVASNSHPNVYRQKSPLLNIQSIAGIIFEGIN